MIKRIIIDHPFFSEFVKACQSCFITGLSTEERHELKEYSCTLYTPRILKNIWPGWELGLPRPPNFVPKKNREEWNKYVAFLLLDFFKRVENRQLYCDYSAVVEKFGGGVENRIGKKSGLEFNLEAVYWTFNVKFNKWINQNRKVYSCSLVCNLDEILARFDSCLREAFFPTPGPHDIGPKKRKKLEDQMLRDFAPNLREALMKEIWEEKTEKSVINFK